MEFRKINSDEITAVCLMKAQPRNNKIGLSKIPPPIPITPEINPIEKDLKSSIITNQREFPSMNLIPTEIASKVHQMRDTSLNSVAK